MMWLMNLLNGFYFLLLLGTNAAQEALCWICTEGDCSSVLLHGICLSRCLCSAVFGRVVSCWIIFFCVCPIVCHSVCVLTLGIWYPCKKCLSLNIVSHISCGTNPCNIWHYAAWLQSFLSSGKDKSGVCLMVMRESGSIVYFHSPWLLDLHWLSLSTIGQSSSDSWGAD